MNLRGVVGNNNPRQSESDLLIRLLRINSPDTFSWFGSIKAIQLDDTRDLNRCVRIIAFLLLFPSLFLLDKIISSIFKRLPTERTRKRAKTIVAINLLARASESRFCPEAADASPSPSSDVDLTRHK
jgi:hypothetical protein